MTNFNTNLPSEVGQRDYFNKEYPPSVGLTRISSIYKSGTVGVLTINTKFFCMTLEPPKFGNKRRKSCIPTGVYSCRQYFSNKFRMTTYAVENVPNRKFILFHRGHTVKDSAGCIMLGEEMKNHNGVLGLASSAAAFDKFIDVMDGQEKFILTIRESI